MELGRIYVGEALKLNLIDFFSLVFSHDIPWKYCENIFMKNILCFSSPTGLIYLHLVNAPSITGAVLFFF